ncbi:peptidoglycan DD-metalloendopeptidase family protein [Patescibacteria group bacterium]|nr:peptidoglycan DD-metalloendopeptidase family protein [Patescibacteria group bacterium]
MILPNIASAFWPFSTDASAAQATSAPDASTPVLQASVNIDPNPNKGLGASLQTSGGKALLAYAGPSGTIADVASSTPSDRISIYVVRPGDTLSEIASMYGVSVNTIIWANNLSGATDVHPGDTLIILPVSGLEHTVAKGDTLKSLAAKYGADATEIAQYNGVDANTPLVIGSRIMIPGGELGGPSQSSPAKRPGGSRSTKDPYRGGGGALIAGYFSNPIMGGIITQGLHGWNAVDIGAAIGTPIHAAADGTVIIVRNNGGFNGGYGNYVVITHPNGTQTLYAHLRAAIVSPGQEVSDSQIIGYVGMTGHTTGPHVHFEVRGAANPFSHCTIGSACSPQ